MKPNICDSQSSILSTLLVQPINSSNVVPLAEPQKEKLRSSTPKQRARESARETMGLISKDRKRELEMMMKKKKNDKLKVSETPTIIGTPGLDLITLGLVDVEKLTKYELSVEDGRELVKEYSRIMMRKHRVRQASESTLLRMKKEAIEALPEGGLREAALVPDLSPFPANRFMATLTPPPPH
ncbi:hypothetical protein TanjilG_30512 [Lupinus angustifolius]|uniref:Uncharacterized protein n=1 Tax=Lupinus angustifolius TaxID=3871 RepID=A0A1J7GVW2_LUPAN|nr:hypothetical protein TanjilG_30512 [Lupinus angustifolius]